MNIDKLTTKAQEAIREAQQLAETYRHGEVDTLHLVLALVRQEGGVVPSILEKIGVKADLYGEVLDRVLRAGQYWIPNWYSPNRRIAAWDFFGRPEAPPRLDIGIASLWWWDAEKAAATKAKT